jgi:hypothetical protein
MDRAWWRVYGDEVARTFAGECWAPFGGDARLRRTGARRQPNSGAGAIALGAHLGARRIVLLGYDCQKTGGRAHWHADHPGGLGNAGTVGHWPALFRTLARELQGVDVINCSRATALDAFPRRALEEVLCSTAAC